MWANRFVLLWRWSPCDLAIVRLRHVCYGGIILFLNEEQDDVVVNGQPLLEKPRTGEYEAYIGYKSHRGRKLLFQQGRPPKDEAKYVCDNMLHYFITTLFSDDGAYGYLSDVKHVETPISLDVLQ